MSKEEYINTLLSYSKEQLAKIIYDNMINYNKLSWRFDEERERRIETQERINKAIELLQNSQIYNARSNGKTLFIKLIDEEIKILIGDNNG